MALFEVAKYDGSPDVFAWKYPNEELGTWTQLIVNESQEAVLYKNGRALDLFQSGRYTLDTSNIPILRGLINLPFGGRSPFTAEVWYVNKKSTLDIKWGTQSPIQLQDPKYSAFVPVRAYGQFGICIDNSKQFLSKLVGTLTEFDKTALTNHFRGIYLTRVRDAVSSYLIHNKISVMEINSYLNELSEFLKDEIQPTMAEYGIKLLNFYVSDINVPEDDPAVMQLKKALAKKSEMEIVGYNYQQERTFDTLESAAKNEGGMSGLMGAGIGLGLGANIGGALGKQMGELSKSLNPEAETVTCPNCGTVINHKNPKFCPECGKPFEKVCPKCGSKVVAGAKFCMECGEKI